MTKPIATTTARSWTGVAWLTLLGTAGTLGLSLGLNYLLLFSDALTPFARSMITAGLLPVIIGLPLFALIGWNRVEIRRYRQELNKSGTYDRLTGCLNGPVFASMIERRTTRPSKPGPRSGAFLVIHP